MRSRRRGAGCVATAWWLGRKLGQPTRDGRQALLPQIRYWLRTGYVAAGKIINLHVPELYSIVRGKVGKAVEFGLSWGITRLKGGFVLATMARDKGDLRDSTFAVRAVEDLVALVRK